MTAIQFSDVHLSYGKQRVLSGLNLTVPPGVITALVGRNGAGKTSLLKLATAIDRPDRGDVRLLGLTPDDARSFVGFVQEDPTLPPGETALDLVSWVTRLRGTARSSAQASATRALARCGVGHLADVGATTLSRGQRQRVALAAAIAHDPKVLLLDEPFSGLDPLHADDLRRLVRELAAAGATVLFTTHQPDDVALVADRVAVLGDGVVLADDTLAGLRGRIAGGALDVEPIGPLDAAIQAIARLPGVAAVRPVGARARVTPSLGADTPTVIAAIATATPCRSLGEYQPTLAEVFLSVSPTGATDA
jgi:ABC-2 type transport system ATP-binding protein